MGIKNLNTIIEKYSINGKYKMHLSKLSGKIFAIDTNVYLYKYLYGKSNHINGMFFMINKFKKFNITPIFIFDGKPPDEKLATINTRKLVKYKLEERLLSLKLQMINNKNDFETIELQKEIDNIEKKIIYVNKNIIDKTKTLFDLMGVTYINANCEAEHYCSKLCNLDIVDGVVSEDMDTIACGSKLVLRNFTNRDDNVEACFFDEILYDLDLNYDSFIDLCILLGNDYNYRPRGFSPDELFFLIKKYSSIENILKQEKIVNWNCDYSKIRELLKLDLIVVDTSIIENHINKKPDINSLKSFLKESSTIDEKTYLHRINLIFNTTDKIVRLYKHPYKLYKNYKINTNNTNDKILEF